MKKLVWICCLTLVLTGALQIRLSHDLKKGYSYQISGPDPEEVIETDKKMRAYIRSQAPKKTAGPAPSLPAAKPAPAKPIKP